RSLIQAVSREGYAAIPASEREGVSEPAPAIEAYEDMLLASWRDHLPPDKQQDAALARQDEEFRRFVESQLVWDRAMAQGIANAADQKPGVVVVGLMGSGHVIHGWGVPHQLQQMGQNAPLTLLPWDREADCAELADGIADAVFGVAAPARPATVARPRLGITLEPADSGVRIGEVTAGSIAERTGLRKGDVITEIAGVRPEQAIEVAAAVARQAPGTWLPLKIQRGSRTLEFVAKFPAAKEP
ncbi:MAG TPA: ChaN family lipoprotein, partial [Steroidobacteraceae bacterium]|nr:ChaN family lipoprotein [Steroidobacteraceae bacterium]